MKRGFFIALWLLGVVVSANAQHIKTGVLVIGNGNSALGAGIQAAQSGVKTTLLLTEIGFDLTVPKDDLPSGIGREFLKRLKTKTASENLNDLLKTWTDSVKNLTVMKNTSWIKFKRSGSGWNVELSDGKTIKAEVLVDADRLGKVKAALELPDPGNQWQSLNYENTLYRTSVAGGYAMSNTNANLLSLHQLLIPEQENLIILNPDQQSFAAGQAAGATAAWPAFFHRKLSEVTVKSIQGELINYKLSLMPFADVSELDSNWKAIQYIGLTGFLKAELTNGVALFIPEQQVSAGEIKASFKEYFYKSQIWFDEYKDPELTIGAVLKLVCYVGGKAPESTKAELIKNWKKRFEFKTEFDEKRVITRREFSMMVYNYCNPFNVNIDKTGKVQR